MGKDRAAQAFRDRETARSAFLRGSIRRANCFNFDKLIVFLLSSSTRDLLDPRHGGAERKEDDMRTLIGALAGALMISGAAYAAEAEGQIQSIDRDNLTITLDNGKSYKLPGEFDVDIIKEGMEILLAYDEVGGQNLITDMELSE
jgi:hypothetical protein